jgi:hypothetical protein
MDFGVRTVMAMGSFQDCWGILFLASVEAVALGYLFVFLVGYLDVAKPMVWAFLGLTLGLFSVSAFFFLFAIFVEVPIGGLDMTQYMQYNPLYERSTGLDATIFSVGVGSVLLCIACGILGTMTLRELLHQDP